MTVDELAGHVAIRAGNPYVEQGLAFTFVTGDIRRSYRWDIPGGRVEVKWKSCTAVVRVPQPAGDPVLDEAWSAFVNDQYWLLAPSKVLDAGVARSVQGTDLHLSFTGVGLTPGDTYVLHTDTDGDITGWDYTLQGGRSGSWTWADPVEVGSLRVSVERRSGERTIRFEGVTVGPQVVGEVGGTCPTP